MIVPKKQGNKSRLDPVEESETLGHGIVGRTYIECIVIRKPYSRNPLRAQGIELDDYVVVNTHLSFHYQALTLGLTVLNTFDASYYHPGVGAADSGDDFGERSPGFGTSLIPTIGRSYRLTLGVSF